MWLLLPVALMENRCGHVAKIPPSVSEFPSVAPQVGGTDLLRIRNEVVGPAESAAVLRNGWMHPRDVGYMVKESFAYFTDQLTDMTVSGAENVYSIEVASVIYQYPAVTEWPIIAVPDDRWSEWVHAIVTLKPGATLTLEQLRVHCRAHIARWQCPSSLQIASSALLRGTAGKQIRRPTSERRFGQAGSARFDGRCPPRIMLNNRKARTTHYLTPSWNINEATCTALIT